MTVGGDWRILVAALLAGLCAVGCRAGPQSRGFPPFLETGTRDGQQEFTLRPLFSSIARPEERFRETVVLWPVGLFRSEGRERLDRVLPIFQRSWRLDHRGFLDRDFFIFPFYYQGHSEDEGSYLCLFPILGNLKGWLGKDVVKIVLFPLYAKLEDRKRFDSWHVLWPIFNRIEGNGWKGWRVWPFYGRYTRTDFLGRPAYDRRFVLWPFFHLQDNNLNGRNPSRTWFLFPFYGRIRSTNRDEWTVLFPLFKRSIDRSKGIDERRAPFPFVVWADGKEYRKLDFWPIYGYRRHGDYYRHFFLSPIERYERMERGHYTNERLWILPFFWWYHTQDRRTGAEATRLHVFPFYREVRSLDGSVWRAVIALEWFRDHAGGFDRTWPPLWRIYTYERDGTARSERSTWLYGVYRRERDRRAGWTEHSFLDGLVERRVHEDGRRAWRLLWFFRLGGASPAPADDAPRLETGGGG